MHAILENGARLVPGYNFRKSKIVATCATSFRLVSMEVRDLLLTSYRPGLLMRVLEGTNLIFVSLLKKAC